jgi:transcription antitermination factor NusG
MSAKWYALRVKPHKEQVVCRQLQTQEIGFYYPALRVKPVNPRSAKIRPFFPGYLFVRLDLQQTGPNALQWLPGVQGLVSFGSIPTPVADPLIAELQRRLRAIEAAGGLNRYQIQPGDTVRIVAGPLAGYEAIFDAHLSGAERVRVLLAFLSAGPQPVELEATAVQKIKRR